MTITQAVPSWKTTEAEEDFSSASICSYHRSCDVTDSLAAIEKTPLIEIEKPAQLQG